MNDENKTIAIGKNKDPYQVPLNLLQMAKYLEYFGSNSKRELKHIYGLLDLDSPSRKIYGNTIEFKTDEKERRKLQNINKALTFAQGGVPDVQINYGNFMVILEVSAKYQPPLEHYKKQLSGALKHARSVREDGYDKPIYCLLINERSLKLVENIYATKELLDKIKPSEQIYIAVTSIDEFAELGQTMAETYEDDISKIHSDDLHEVLKATAEKGIYGKFHEILVEHLDAVKSPTHDLGF